LASDSPTLTIRGQRSDDLEHLFALINTDAVLLDSLELPYLSEEIFRERYGNPPANTYTLIAETSLPSGRKRMVGVVWLGTMRSRRRHVGRLTLAIHPDYRGSEAESTLLDAALDLADNWLDLRRVEGVVYVDDRATIALYERHGFTCEAAMRRYAFRAGVYSDACLMARLRTSAVSSDAIAEKGESHD
jgi:putative acetyltransferase